MELQHPSFLHFIVYFNCNQDYFECHEVLEEYWKSIPNSTKEHPLTAFILLATGMYHWRRGNTIGAVRTLAKVAQKMDQWSPTTNQLFNELDLVTLRKNVTTAIRQVRTDQSFTPFTLQLSPVLQQLVRKTARTMKLLPKDSDVVIHKHMPKYRTFIPEK